MGCTAPRHFCWEGDLPSFFVPGGQEKSTGDLGWQIWQRDAERKPSNDFCAFSGKQEHIWECWGRVCGETEVCGKWEDVFEAIAL